MKRLLILIFSIAMAVTAIVSLTACNNTDSGNGTTVTGDGNNTPDNKQQERVELTAADIYSKVNPSVVFILLEKKGAYVSGSGFFIDKNGTVVTNYHVIKDTLAGVIQLCDGTVENIVNILGYDEKLDIAILETTAKNTPAVTKSNEQIRVGETVYAIGYPEAFILGASSSTFTTGMVSMNRSVSGYNYIQSTVDITNGNSGGVLINKYGEAVGITTAGINLEKIDYMNLSIPIQRVDTIQRNVNEPLEITTKRHHPVYVTYMADGYRYNVQSITYETKTAAPADPAKVGYTFNGWYLDNDYKKPFDFETILLENTTLFAKFSINNYTVSYDLDDGDWGDETPPQTYTIDNCDTALPTPKREGCLFEWWLDGDGKYLLNYPNKSSLQNLSLKASWIKDADGLVIENGVVKKYNGSLTKVVIPASFRGKSVTSIDSGAFSGCTSLTSVTIPDNVTSIGSDAFYDCPIESAIIPASAIKHIPLTNLKTITLVGKSSICDYAFSGCTSLESITISENVMSIGVYAFYNCTSLTNLTIPDSVTSISFGTFWGCTSLTSITIPGNVKRIGNSAFKNCTSLSSITIPNSVTSIGDMAFSYCYSLTSIIIPNSVTSIGDMAFRYCFKLVEVINNSKLNVKKGNNNYGGIAYYALNVKNDKDSDIENKDGYLFYTYDKVNYLLSYTGTDTVITLPAKYNGQNYAIYPFAFHGNISLTSITIPDSVTSIGGSAFSGCISLTSITIPNSVTSIDYGAFWGCASLTDITIPDSITSIGSNAFFNCTSLKTINYKGGKEQWDLISKGTDWDYETGNYTINYNYVEN